MTEVLTLPLPPLSPQIPVSPWNEREQSPQSGQSRQPSVRPENTERRCTRLHSVLLLSPHVYWVFISVPGRSTRREAWRRNSAALNLLVIFLLLLFVCFAKPADGAYSVFRSICSNLCIMQISNKLWSTNRITSPPSILHHYENKSIVM